jgi:hypothetical protein
LEPRESVLSASSPFVFQVGGNVLAIISVWTALAGLRAVTGTMGSGWQGRVVGALALIGSVGLFWLGKTMAIENRVMRHRRD